MGLGLEGAYGAAGAADALRQLIKDRFERERQLHAQSIQDSQLANQTEQLRLTGVNQQNIAEENKRQHDLMNADRLFKENTTLNESIQPGARFQGSNPIVGRLMPVGGVRSAGIDVAPPDALAATPGQSAEVPGTISNAPSPGMREYTKLETQKQYDTRTDNQRQQETVTRQEARDAALAKVAEASLAETRQRDADTAAYHRGMLAKPTSATQSFDDWQQRWDYQVEHPKPTTGGGTGGPAGVLRARAESAAQMLDRLKTVHAQLNAGEGPGQIVKGVTQRIKGALNLDNTATEYQKLRQATAIALAVAVQGSRPSDREAEALAQLLPDYNTPAAVATNLFNSAATQLQSMSGGGGAPLGSLKPAPSHGPTAAPGKKKYEILSVE